ncbi:hypothetical protein HRR83_008144 [Exophiala dermatitidis]|uniref:Uncharacterized protein n=2 Tax=Exophiala dermatitidis TaxID=5970 RepID=H6BT28_EXODN|nr:uncharacterized protein HMPREF1120_02449 [Exophiala dermatitidis NIH/UT8656]KAJ4505868.1 hypothetical protein HRR75_007249 [Exophiala dermatitidis]EHY54279.1 hypothetical protein HMPREF1120_02449 [Exophiala dermatitidis NIH/UT8656]KAJ4508016.1 hypothetical protein HRR74_007901 [Exophiala dermatitidis]KAJ4513574.1 hypothetical protein HRR73_005732 [Exophiala dermatitidis]KAJ4535583.1 hypothetical protein HRR77_007901 [Exophiala dermatitidis]
MEPTTDVDARETRRQRRMAAGRSGGLFEIVQDGEGFSYRYASPEPLLYQQQANDIATQGVESVEPATSIESSLEVAGGGSLEEMNEAAKIAVQEVEGAAPVTAETAQPPGQTVSSSPTTRSHDCTAGEAPVPIIIDSKNTEHNTTGAVSAPTSSPKLPRGSWEGTKGNTTQEVLPQGTIDGEYSDMPLIPTPQVPTSPTQISSEAVKGERTPASMAGETLDINRPSSASVPAATYCADLTEAACGRPEGEQVEIFDAGTKGRRMRTWKKVDRFFSRIVHRKKKSIEPVPTDVQAAQPPPRIPELQTPKLRRVISQAEASPLQQQLDLEHDQDPGQDEVNREFFTPPRRVKVACGGNRHGESDSDAFD